MRYQTGENKRFETNAANERLKTNTKTVNAGRVANGRADNFARGIARAARVRGRVARAICGGGLRGVIVEFGCFVSWSRPELTFHRIWLTGK